MNCTDLKERVFRALRLYKETEKRNKVWDSLENNEKPSIAQNGDQIKNMKTKADRNARERAVKGGIMNPFKKLLKMYFSKWKGVTKDVKVLMNDKFK